MAKHSCKRRNKSRRNRRRNSKKMFGGALTQENISNLKNLGFTTDQVEELKKMYIESILIPFFKRDIENGNTPQNIINEIKKAKQEIALLEEEETGFNTDNEDEESQNGGKKRRKKTRRCRTLRGGTCYGSGVGANNYDPNFSIYNTRELQLFPYKPTQG